MAALEPYISFGGKTAEAMDYYKSVFGGEANVQLAKDGPMADKTPEDRKNDVFHADLTTAAGFHILGSDMMSGDEVLKNNVISLALMPDSEEQLQEYFDKLSNGGKVVWPVRESEWGSTYAQVVDKYGVQWMLNFDKAGAATA